MQAFFSYFAKIFASSFPLSTTGVFVVADLGVAGFLATFFLLF